MPNIMFFIKVKFNSLTLNVFTCIAALLFGFAIFGDVSDNPCFG